MSIDLKTILFEILQLWKKGVPQSRRVYKWSKTTKLEFSFYLSNHSYES